VINIKSTSIDNTTYAKFTSGGATETIALAPASGVSQYGYNNVNLLTSIAAGGAARFQGTTNKALKSATISSLPANLPWSESFNGNALLSNGANNVPVSATDGASNVKTNNYQVPITGPGSATLTFDANGNMTSDGLNSYLWDARSKLIGITYPGTGNNSQFLCDGMGRQVQIVETRANAVIATKQFLRYNSAMLEERDATGTTTKKFFAGGQVIGSTVYFYDLDHLGSIRELTDISADTQSIYYYDAFGQQSKIGTVDSDFQFTGYYIHLPSALNMSAFRMYSPSQARWLNRDPIEESGGVNLYAYVSNSPIGAFDPLGLSAIGDKILNEARKLKSRCWSPGAKQCNVLVNMALVSAGAVPQGMEMFKA